jgi:hypothetical protein
MGLLLSHKRTLKVYADRYVVSAEPPTREHVCGERGDIENFSSASRKRLFELLHGLIFERVTFVTLTYPAEFPTESKVYKGHLKEFRRRFERVFGKVRAVWRLEFQARGAPHYHILFFDAPFFPVFRVSALWHSVIHSEDDNHLKNGVDIKLVTGKKEKRLITSYVAKYIAKVDKGTDNGRVEKVGRYWGRWNIEDPAPVTIEVSSGEASLLYGSLRGGVGGGVSWTPTDDTRCTVYGDSLGSFDFGDRIIREVERIRFRGRKR